jgi:formate hydrogenlyase subunit 3/multisubunit Na+/H+ antiporter MnhD subunit
MKTAIILGIITLIVGIIIAFKRKADKDFNGYSDRDRDDYYGNEL